MSSKQVLHERHVLLHFCKPLHSCSKEFCLIRIQLIYRHTYIAFKMNFKTVLKNHPCRVCSGCLVLLGLAVILLVTLMTSSNKLGGNIILSIISVNHFCQAYPQSLNTNPRDWGWGWHPQHVPNFYHLLPLIYVLLIMFSSIMISLVLAVCLVRIWGGQIWGILPRFFKKETSSIH